MSVAERQSFIIYDQTTGLVMARMSADPAIQQPLPGQALLVMDPMAADLIGDPSDEAKAIVLAGVRAALWEKVKILRLAHIDGGFAVEGVGRFQSDPESRENIHGAATGALLAQVAGQPFSVIWTLADNSAVELSGAEMLGVGQEMLAHINAAYETARSLRSELDAQETLQPVMDGDEVIAPGLLTIDVTAGWEG